MEDFYETFRLNMKFYREKIGFSQSELAIQANSSNGMIGNIESGKAKPSFDNILIMYISPPYYIIFYILVYYITFISKCHLTLL